MVIKRTPATTQPRRSSARLTKPIPSPKTVLELPEEVLLQVCREVRAAERPLEHHVRHIEHVQPPHREFGPTTGSTSYALTLTSRKINGPATQVLYEHVDLSQYNIRQFLFTVISSPAHAGMIRSLKVRDYSGSSENPPYKPSTCYHVSDAMVEEQIKIFASSQQIPDLLETTANQKRVVPDADVEQLLVALAAENLKEVDMEVLHPGTVHHQRRDVIKPSRLYAGLTCNSEPNTHFGDRITSLRLRSPGGYRAVELRSVVDVLVLPALRLLTLERFESAATDGSSHTLAAALRKTKPAGGIDSLHLLECDLRAADLSSLVKACPGLRDMTWRCNERAAWQLGGYKGSSCLKTEKVIKALEPCASSLKTFTFDHLEEIKDWSGVARRMSLNHFSYNASDMLNTQQQYCGPASFINFTSLESMEVTSCAILGVHKDPKDDINFADRLPPKLRTLRLRMPQEPFPTRIYNKVPGTRHWSMLAKMSEELIELDLGLPLRYVEVKIPDGWPTLATRTAHTLAKAVSSVKDRVRLVLDGQGCWKLDSNDPLPIVEKKTRKKVVKEEELSADSSDDDYDE